jgi:hypothetical protein
VKEGGTWASMEKKISFLWASESPLVKERRHAGKQAPWVSRIYTRQSSTIPVTQRSLEKKNLKLFCELITLKRLNLL